LDELVDDQPIVGGRLFDKREIGEMINHARMVLKKPVIKSARVAQYAAEDERCCLPANHRSPSGLFQSAPNCAARAVIDRGRATCTAMCRVLSRSFPPARFNFDKLNAAQRPPSSDDLRGICSPPLSKHVQLVLNFVFFTPVLVRAPCLRLSTGDSDY
jgi:hypothetical protein